MLCVSLIGTVLMGIILNVALNVGMDDDNPNKGTIQGFGSAVLFIWWLLGFLMECENVIGPVIDVN